MVHDDRTCPVSGEIMSAAPTSGSAARLYATEDVSDAQFETVDRSDLAMPGDSKSFANAAPFPAHGSDGVATPIAGMDFLKQAGAGAKQSRRAGPLFWSAGLVMAGLAFWVSGGHALVAEMGSAASVKMPLQIAGVASRVETHGSGDVLFVDGRAENHGERALALPPIEIAVTSLDGGVTRYQLDRRAAQLQPGDHYAFSSRLAAPGGGVKTVSVAFAEEGN